MALGSIVLIVDPDQNGSESYSETLHRKGFLPVPVRTGEEALSIAASADLVITSLQLPGKVTGLDLVTRLRRGDHTRDIPIVVLSATDSDGDRAQARAAGCNLFLTKPCLASYLMGRVRRLLRVNRGTVRHRRVQPQMVR